VLYFQLVCVVILITMCCNLNLYYVLYFQFYAICFLKIVVHKRNSKIVKSIIVKLTRREKSNATDTDVTMV
jgi:hypothetical protein